MCKFERNVGVEREGWLDSKRYVAGLVNRRISGGGAEDFIQSNIGYCAPPIQHVNSLMADVSARDTQTQSYSIPASAHQWQLTPDVDKNAS